jgi:hypothetical protein
MVPCLVAAMFSWAIVRDKHPVRALHHSLMVSGFGIICGISVLGPLFVYGGFNAHNDTFTYLVHAHWLQEFAFGQIISPDKVSPLTTQVSLYQNNGFRMGASFLLALLQAVFNLRWSYEIYPAVVISAMTACFLAIGFPLARVLRPIRRSLRLMLLSLPAFSFGGLIFGGNQGFFPQTVGLAFGAALLFATGSLFRWLITQNETRSGILKASIPYAVLLAGTIYAYSEIAPFILVSIFLSGIIVASRTAGWSRMLIFIGAAFGLALLLLNTEIGRAYAALKIQSGVAVGTPVDWPLYGYLAHAFGAHGGAWVGFQWSNSENAGSVSFFVGMAIFVLIIGILVAETRAIWRMTMGGIFMPTVVILFLFAAGVFYFRYFVSSPFPRGVGQSWSQFKLSEWAHPFGMALVLLAIARLRLRLGKYFSSAVVALFATGVFTTVAISVERVTPLMHYYGRLNDLNRFYLDFRKTVLDTCSATAPVYLALGGNDHKFRQLAALYLYDRDVRSDWTDDGYIYPRLPDERRTQNITAGSCVVERGPQDGWLRHGTPIGPFIVGVFDGQARIRITSVTGAYGRETDGKNWWHWVEHKATFKLQTLFIPRNATRTKLQFGYGTRGRQTIILRITKRDGSTLEFAPQSIDSDSATFERVIDLPATEITEFSLETDGNAWPLGDKDARLASWIVRNVAITSVSP